MSDKFVKQFFLCFFLLLPLIALFTFLVDPYLVYNTPRIKGVNDNKAAAGDRFSVAVQMIKQKPKFVVLGSSRTQKLSPFIEKYANGESFYNAAFSGADFNEIYAYFQHALYLQPDLKTVILGIDLFAFNPNRKPANTYETERLCRKTMTLKDLKGSLLSYNALANACHTLFINMFSPPQENVILKMGEREYLKEMLDNEENYHKYQIDEAKIQKFQSLVNSCKEKGIDLKVLIHPLKAMYWDFYFNNDLWPHVEQLKQKLCNIHPIWDFSGFNPFTTETLDCGGEPLYHECSHFTEYAGSLLLQRMFGEPSLIDHVGYLLTPENLEKVAEEIKEQRLLWLSAKSK